MSISETQDGSHQTTDSPVFCRGKTYHPADGLKRVPNRRNSRPVQSHWHSPTGQLLPLECSSAKLEYNMYHRELVATVQCLRQWRHYCEGANWWILVQCDRKILEYFKKSKVVSQGQLRWAEILSSYDSFIQQLERKKHPADGPS